MAGSNDPPGFKQQRGTKDRREHERRSGADRRIEDRRRPEGERRQGERRSGRDRRDESAWQAVSIDAASTASLDDGNLVAAAIEVRQRAHARFSNFKVGAALETDTGDVVTGCNIENATYGLTMCAERVALYKALSDGHKIFTRVAVVADTDDPTPPCGSCRQLLWEYCGDIEVILANLTEVKRRMRLSQLLPLPFDARLLE